MRITPLLVGLLMIVVGVIAVGGGDLWDNWQWIVAAGALVVGIGGLISALMPKRVSG